MDDLACLGEAFDQDESIVHNFAEVKQACTCRHLLRGMESHINTKNVHIMGTPSVSCRM